MKQILALFITLSLSLPTWAQKPNWNKLADQMSAALIEHFWGASFEGFENRHYFNYGSDLSDLTTEHYWPQAHAMDVVVDAYLRTKDKKYKALMPLWFEGMPRYNFARHLNPADPWWNVYVDDMEWHVLTLIRMFEATGETRYIAKARQMYDQWIWPTWGPEDEAPWHGGITWKTDVGKSKNACSNGPAALIAARLYRFYNKAGFNTGKPRETYLSEAKKIYEWEKRVLFDSETGAVWDNIDRHGRVQKHWIFTYNQGTFLGAAHELFGLTGDRAYLDTATKAADYVTHHMVNDKGLLSDATSGDGGLFHGIFFRYFVKLATEPALSEATRQAYTTSLTHWGTALATKGVNPQTHLYAGRWQQAPADKEKVCLTAHTTGCMLVEALAKP